MKPPQRSQSPLPKPRGHSAVAGLWGRQARSAGEDGKHLLRQSQQLRDPTGSSVMISSFSSKIELVQSQNLICEPSALDSKPFTLSGSC